MTVPVTFVIVLAFMAIVAMYQRGRLTDYLGAGFLCGLACATKYSALPVVLIFGLAHLMARTPRQWVGLKAAVGLAAIPLGFLTAYPYALLQWEPFLDKLGWHAGFSAATFDPADRFRYLIEYSMESGLGLLFTLALGGALVYYVHRRRSEELLLVALITALAVSLTHSSFRFFPRYLLPIHPLRRPARRAFPRRDDRARTRTVRRPLAPVAGAGGVRTGDGGARVAPGCRDHRVRPSDGA